MSTTGQPGRHEPLGPVTSIKVKLGLLVAASVLVAAVLATWGAGTVPAVLSIPVTVLLALGVTQLLAVGMTSPLRQMTEAARRMAAGDYAVRVQTGSSDEVGELARAFNTMAADLATVDRQRRELVATVSHELRTPLAALVAVLENLDDGVTDPDPQTVRVARAQAERLADLVEDLLDLSRLDAGVVALERAETPVGSLVESVVEEARSSPVTTARGVVVRTSVTPPTLTAYADRARLHQLLANLLDNAVRHSPPGGVVRVEAAPVGGGLRLEVSDEGPGIAPADRERVFERFGTLPDSAGGGTGLGLAIARWVVDLHGGRIAVVDPVPGETGARFRIDLPPSPSVTEPPVQDPVQQPVQRPVPQPVRYAVQHPGPPPVTNERTAPMDTTPSPTAPPPAPSPTAAPHPAGASLTDELFGSMWPERRMPGRPAVLLACGGIGLLAGASLPFAAVGLGAALVLVAAGVLVLRLSPHRDSPFTWASAVLCTGFAAVLVLRDALWLGTLGLLVAAVLVTASLTAGRSVLGMATGWLAWPLAGLRGLPWLGRTLRGFGGSPRAAAVARTTALSLLATVVFGLLFASGDAVVGRWVGAVVPDLGDSLALRLFVAVAVTGTVLAAAYLALNPPPVERPQVKRPVQHRFEWLAPVLLVDAVFLLFLAAQAAVFFGGDDYVQRTTGLTYAAYVHQGFAQLTLATALTLLVVSAAARKARLTTAADRWWLRGSLGLLALLTLVVVASALHRMDLYQDAYGFTRLRLLVDLFEGWLGLVVVAVLVAGIRLRGDWLPRAALLSGAVLLLGLAAVNPDAWIARHNVERFEATGKVDWVYLQNLSADAIPVLAALPPEQAACALGRKAGDGSGVGAGDGAGGWAAWNLARDRARDLLASTDLPDGAVCPTTPTPRAG